MDVGKHSEACQCEMRKREIECQTLDAIEYLHASVRKGEIMQRLLQVLLLMVNDLILRYNWN